MNIKETIAIINQMQADGVIGKYAIGGAVGATFYLEPADTQDVDIFVALNAPVGQSIVTLTPIYEYLIARGCQPDKEYIIISGWPVQILPAESPLLQEALEQSVERDFAGTPVRVFAAEHLAAIALQTGRSKDYIRIGQFREAGVLNEPRFQSILERHGLLDLWAKFKKRFDI
jgi:hypothetical protein